MVSQKSVTKQLREAGCDYALWGRTETHELANILMEDEHIMQAINGYYDGGFALLCTTNYRVLVIDKKPFLLTVEDLRYDMIAEVDYSARIFTAVLRICTPLRTLMFTSWSLGRLRKTMNYIQQRVMEVRNNDYWTTQFATASARQSSTPLPEHRPVARKKLFPLYAARRDSHSSSPDKLNVERPVGFEGYIETPADPMHTTDPETYRLAKRVINPYTRVPLLARRRKYPSFY